MPANNHITYTSDEEVIAALFKAGGNVSKTAKLLGLSDIADLRKRIQKKPELLNAKQEAIEQMLDKAEEKILKGMTKNDAKWILERKGRMRGWGTVIANANLNMNVEKYDLEKYPLEDRMKLLEMLSVSDTNENSNIE
jgi:regulatory Fis family protein